MLENSMTTGSAFLPICQCPAWLSTIERSHFRPASAGQEHKMQSCDDTATLNKLEAPQARGALDWTHAFICPPLQAHAAVHPRQRSPRAPQTAPVHLPAVQL